MGPGDDDQSHLKSPLSLCTLLITRNTFTLLPRGMLKSLLDVAFTETPMFWDDVKSYVQG